MLNPDRDLGPTDIHGITGHDVRDAPRFGDVAGEILEHLRGHVPVAHNARFDRAFLESEFARVSVDISDATWLCTMSLAARLGCGGRLVDCCNACGIAVSDSHSALGDAHACARLLSFLAETSATNQWPEPCGRRWHGHPGRHPGLARSIARNAPRGRSFVGELVARLDQSATHRDIASTEALGYLQILDRALADRRVSEDEIVELAAVADMYELDQAEIRQLHERYVGQLLALALADGVVTSREQADLELVAALLDVNDPLQLKPGSAGDQATGTQSLAGKSVCFTGTLTCYHDGVPMTRDVAARLAEAAGLVVCPRVTQALDLLVVADPETMSGKARKARAYGTRIIAETAFWPLLGVEVR